MTSRLRGTAYHEAGHAVVALALGRGVEAITIVRNEYTNVNGSCWIYPGWEPFEIEAERTILIALAGDTARRKAVGWCEPRAAAGDRRKAWLLARRLAQGDRDAAKAYLARLRKRVRELLDRSLVWHLVEALLIRRTLSGIQIDAVVRRARLARASQR